MKSGILPEIPTLVDGRDLFARHNRNANWKVTKRNDQQIDREK
jgi:hypothetical protein